MTNEWFESWGWIAWIFIGAIGYEICLAITGDKEPTRPFAVVGACVLGPLMLIPIWLLSRLAQLRAELQALEEPVKK